LNGSETVKIEEFIFGVEFFLKGKRLPECTALFQNLDAMSKDKMLDMAEFSQILPIWKVT
jgi:hypothetical protein